MFVSEDRPSRRTASSPADRSATSKGSALCYGRFVQTDPLGYKDGLNWYNYVGGDPVNSSDPTGTEEGDIFSTRDGAAIDANRSYFRRYSVEWSGIIYSYSGIFGGKYYSYTANRGETHSGQISVSYAPCVFYSCQIVGGWHVHNTNLSPNSFDTKQAYRNGIALYTGVGAKVYVANSSGATISSSATVTMNRDGSITVRDSVTGSRIRQTVLTLRPVVVPGGGEGGKPPGPIEENDDEEEGSD